MRLSRFRFTVRRMMAAVAVAAVLLAGGHWSWKMIRASLGFRSRAAGYAELEAELRTWTAEWEASRPSKQRTEMMGSLGRRAEHARGLGLKYARAARSPWLPVAPDPTEPD